MSEYWYHGGGCRAWLKVARNTLTHEISSVEPAAGAGACEGRRADDHRAQIPSPRQSGGLIDRSAPLTFTFDGKTLAGFQGDTLASALIANGVKLVGRSFKYHRPRGILTAGSEEPNALVELRSGARREPNTKATTTELYDGLEAASQNRWPSLRHDLMAVNQLFSPIFVAGFYYKTFMWPAKFWEAIYEPAIRRAAGLGRAAGVADPDHYDKAWAHCDVLIAGGGPAGLSAALAAGRCGARVILCDEDFALGGRLLSDGGTIDGMPAAEWIAGDAGRTRRAARRPHHDAGPRCSASMTAAPMARSSGSTITCPSRRSIRCGSGCGGSWPSAASSRPAPSNGRSSLPATTRRA